MNVLEQETSRLSLGRKLLYVDALNYGGKWFGIRFARGSEISHWQFTNVLTNIQSFVAAATRSGYQLKIFIDAVNQTGEAVAKWEKRREKEVREGVRRMPQGLSVLIEEAFRKCRVDVCYSYDADNDDTLAAYAWRDGAAILSGDRDFFRYRGCRFEVYEGYDVIGGRLRLFPLSDRPAGSSYRPLPRDIINPPPATRDSDPGLGRLREMRYERGAPSPLVRLAGNLHINARPLRQALYARLGLQGSVTERFPVWDSSRYSAVWVEADVVPDAAYDRYLDRPREAVVKIFGELAKSRPAGASNFQWENHRYAMHAVVFELCLWAGNLGSVTLTDLLTDAKALGGYVPESRGI
ncbi:hypothetical protein HDV00_001138 [Rhizophlyctis rosea]|nr:hypothetical protein HDV00_001138 [Rhizophlyctis rosea]